MQISTIIITFNEERNIKRCIESITDLSDEIIVVDSYSNDKTVDIAKEMGAEVYTNRFDGYIEQKNYALTKAQFEYVLSLDADEALDDTLKAKIGQIKKSQIAADGYIFNRLTNFCGQWIRHCGWYPDKKLRLFKKEYASFAGRNPHDHVVIKDESEIEVLTGDLLHYSFNSITEHISQINKFSSIGAKTAYEKGKKVIFPIHIIGNPIFTFIKKYFFQLGFLDGLYGFVICFNTAYSKYIKYIKLRELHKGKNI